jgi:hypothetical protein
MTGLERGLPNASVERDGKMEPNMILDDQALVVKLKERGKEFPSSFFLNSVGTKIGL